MTDPVPPRDEEAADATLLAGGSPAPPPAGDTDGSQVYPAAAPASTSRMARLRARRVSLGVVLAALLVGGVLGAGAMAVAGHGDRGAHRFADQQGRNGGPGGSGPPGYGGRYDGGQFGGQFGGPGVNPRGNGNGFPRGQGNQGGGPAPVPSASSSTSSSASSST